MTDRCEGCGQPRLVEGAGSKPGLCNFCRERGSAQPVKPADRLFEPAAAPMPGQAELFDPDRGER